MFPQIYEDPELEVARLAAAPEGSTNHRLSKLPVNITGPLDDLLIELPSTTADDHTLVVVPFRRDRDDEPRTLPMKRHRGFWACIVVASNHPSYPVGGHRLNISESELVRGKLRTIELAQPDASPAGGLAA